MEPTELQALKAKYLLLISGQTPRAVYDGNTGDRLEFSAADSDKFLAYIRIYDPSFMVSVVPIAARITPPIGFRF